MNPQMLIINVLNIGHGYPNAVRCTMYKAQCVHVLQPELRYCALFHGSARNKLSFRTTDSAPLFKEYLFAYALITILSCTVSWTLIVNRGNWYYQ